MAFQLVVFRMQAAYGQPVVSMVMEMPQAQLMQEGSRVQSARHIANEHIGDMQRRFPEFAPSQCRWHAQLIETTDQPHELKHALPINLTAE